MEKLGWPEPYIYAIYNRIFDEILQEIPYIHHTFGSLQPWNKQKKRFAPRSSLGFVFVGLYLGRLAVSQQQNPYSEI